MTMEQKARNPEAEMSADNYIANQSATEFDAMNEAIQAHSHFYESDDEDGAFERFSRRIWLAARDFYARQPDQRVRELEAALKVEAELNAKLRAALENFPITDARNAEEPKEFAYPIETQRTGNLSISMPRWFEDDEKCGWCGREPGEKHKPNCRQ